ncbi:MAG: hypothetical protein AAGE59_19800 [Cyanobacteria bacterium P01_F01_bin.86]
MYQLTSAIEHLYQHSTRKYLNPWAEPERASSATPQTPWDANIQRLSRESKLHPGKFQPIASRNARVEVQL